MPLQRPASYRPTTWERIAPILERATQRELESLARKAELQYEPDEELSLIDLLLFRGGFLLVEFGLTKDPAIMTATVFSHGGLEYAINRPAAECLHMAAALPACRLSRE